MTENSYLKKTIPLTNSNFNMKRLLNEIGTITNKSTGTVITRVKHGNAIAVMVTSPTYENSTMFNQKLSK